MVEDSVKEQRDNNIGGVTGKGFMPGQSGNPGGRPKGKSLTAVLRELLNQIPQGDNKELKEAVVKALIGKALTGDTRALDIIFDRTDGKVSLPLDVTEIQKIEYVPAKGEEDDRNGLASS